jgi:NADH-quinone oxidoreductase subunit E
MPRRVTRSEPDASGPEHDIDLSKVATIVAEGDPHGNLIALLQRTQQEYGYLPEPVINEIARLSGVSASRIYGIITFYAQFSTVPSGRHKIHVCHGTACHVAGATRVTEALEQELRVEEGATTSDMEFTLGKVACMGACSQAPVMRIDDDTFGNLSADQTRKVIRGLIKDFGLQEAYAADSSGDGAGAGGNGHD